MRSRIGHLSLLVFQVLWLNVFVPGHTRGMITLPETRATAHDTCCGPSQSSKDGQPTPRDRQNCAVCFFAARVTPPPAPDIYLPRLGFVETRDIPQPPEFLFTPLPFAYHGRAPPAC